MFHASRQGRKLEIVHARFEQCGNSFFEQIEKRQLIASAGFARDVEQRNGNRRGRGREIGNDLLVTNRFEHVLHGLSQLPKRDHVLVVSQPQIKRDALGDVIGQPPTRVARFVGRAVDRGIEPIAIKLEELPGIAAQIGKLFFKRDHD
jgi:hypothetical protein